jgi:hypothetical protein
MKESDALIVKQHLEIARVKLQIATTEIIDDYIDTATEGITKDIIRISKKNQEEL